MLCHVRIQGSLVVTFADEVTAKNKFYVCCQDVIFLEMCFPACIHFCQEILGKNAYMQEKTYYVSFVSNIPVYTHVKQSFNGLYFKDWYNIILTVLKFSSQQYLIFIQHCLGQVRLKFGQVNMS